MKLPNTHPSMANHHQSLIRSIFLKRSRHYYGNRYSRHDSTNQANASSSREYREKVFPRPERIRSSSLGMDAVSPNKAEMVCEICEKLLICGHVYHANCLEQITSFEELQHV
ncbi:hypothetical protein HKD37_17G047374 [Glycine soja]